MEIANYGVVLSRLKAEHLEEVRYWRNSSSVKNFMVYQSEISENDQAHWFEKVNNRANYYFVIQTTGLGNIGLVDLKDVDYEKKTAEYGIFMFGEKSQGSAYTSKAVFSLLEFGFEQLNLETVSCSILSSNMPAIRFNKSLGFEINDTENKSVVKGVLQKSVFREKLNKYMRILIR